MAKHVYHYDWLSWYVVSPQCKFSDFNKFPKMNIFRYCVDLQNHTISRKLHQAVKCNHLEFICSCTYVLYTVAWVLADGDAVCLSRRGEGV